MAKKITVSAPDVDKKTLEEAYAAWGTTREEHLAKMKKFIEREKAEAGKPHATAPMVYIDRRAAASRPAAHKPVAYGRAKGVAARTGGWTLAKRLFAVKKIGYGSSSVVQVINRRLKELTGVRVAHGWEIDGLLCAACYADEYGLKNAMLHFTSREIDMERRRRAKAGCGR